MISSCCNYKNIANLGTAVQQCQRKIGLENNSNRAPRNRKPCQGSDDILDQTDRLTDFGNSL